MGDGAGCNVGDGDGCAVGEGTGEGVGARVGEGASVGVLVGRGVVGTTGPGMWVTKRYATATTIARAIPINTSTLMVLPKPSSGPILFCTGGWCLW